MREFKIDGKMFYVNGRLTQLRGTVENCDFPLTGYAPMDEESWERVVPHLPELWAEPHAFPFFLSARTALRRPTVWDSICSPKDRAGRTTG